MKLLEYLDDAQISHFGRWFDDLDAQAAAKVSTALTRLSLGNTSHVKGVGAGVLELKIDFAKGYRIYFGKDGDQLIVLLAGGTKARQQKDNVVAHVRWKNFKDRKKGKA